MKIIAHLSENIKIGKNGGNYYYINIKLKRSRKINNTSVNLLMDSFYVNGTSHIDIDKVIATLINISE